MDWTDVSLDFIPSLTFYSSFHTHPVNVVIHAIFVPMLVALHTADFVALEQALFGLRYVNIFGIPFSLTNLVSVVFYPLVFMRLDIIGGLSYIPIHWNLMFLANWVFAPMSWKKRLLFEVVAWSAQFLGHYVEGAKPALFDSLLQSLCLAIFFIWIEVALNPLGYRSKSMRTVRERVGTIKAAWKRNGGVFNIAGRAEYGVGSATSLIDWHILAVFTAALAVWGVTSLFSARSLKATTDELDPLKPWRSRNAKSKAH